MKKFISLLLVMIMVLSLAACGSNKTEDTAENAEIITNESQDMAETEENEAVTEEQTVTEAEGTENTVTEDETEEPVANEVGQDDSETEETTSSSAPQQKPEEEKKPEQKPSNTTEQKPADTKPEKEDKKEEDKKEDNTKEDNEKEDNTKEDSKEDTASATVGQTLLSVFKKNADSKSAQELADMLITNEVILFMGGSMPIEPGLLSGFDNAEITGFKEGVTFGPMMGSIAFIGYVFEVEDGTDVNAFMKTLKDNANPRWQICVEAEETIVEAVGNKVFFIMCPRSLEQ